MEPEGPLNPLLLLSLLERLLLGVVVASLVDDDEQEKRVGDPLRFHLLPPPFGFEEQNASQDLVTISTSTIHFYYYLGARRELICAGEGWEE